MPAVLTQKSVMLLARARLMELRAALRAKQRRAGAHLTDLDHRVLFLADHAVEMMSTSPAPTDLGPAEPLARAISKFAVMGSAGPGIMGGAKLLREGHDWVFDTMRSGNPDPARSRVVAGTTDFVIKFWQRVGPRVTATADQNAMRAYALGHLCHLATDLVGQPFIDDLESALGIPARPAFTLGGQGAARQLDARTAVQVLDADGAREGQDWNAWWPAPQDVPEPFWESYAQAFGDVYGAAPRAGSWSFQQRFADVERPTMDAALVRDGYELYYHGLLGVNYTYGHWHWAGMFVPLLVTFILELGLFPVLPHARKAFATAPWDLEGDDGDLAWFELFTFPALMSGPAALTYGILSAALSRDGANPNIVFSIISGALLTIGMVAFFATLDTPTDQFSVEARWPLLFGVPLIIPVVFFILAMVNHDRGVGAIQFLHSMPFLVFVLSLVLYFLPFLPMGALAAEAGAEEGGLIATYVVLAVLTLVGFICLWIWASRRVREWALPESPDAEFEDESHAARVSQFPVDRRSLVRLFDEATLFTDPALLPGGAQNNQHPHARVAHHYPTGRRPLIRLWWDGAGDVWIRSDRFQLVFSDHADGSGQTFAVPAPVVPQTAAEYVAYLNGLDVGTPLSLAGQRLQAALAPELNAGNADADLDYELPPGAAFADHGDDHANRTDHDEQAARFRQLGSANDAAAYLLQHAPRSAQSVRFGTKGEVLTDGREDEAQPGVGTVDSSGTTVTGTNTLFDLFFRVGDRIKSGADLRTITRIRSRTVLDIDSAFTPDLAGAAYERVGFEIERREGFQYTSTPGRRVGGDTIMDHAADLAALFCMGAVPHLLPANQRRVSQPANLPGGADVKPVYQVFRNWNLDQRRVNEWRMLVGGEAHSDKGGQATLEDAALMAAALRPAAYAPTGTDAGEAAANRMGWVPLLRRFAEIARDPANPDPLDATATAQRPSNQDVLRGVAFLLDLPEPQAMP